MSEAAGTEAQEPGAGAILLRLGWVGLLLAVGALAVSAVPTDHSAKAALIKASFGISGASTLSSGVALLFSIVQRKRRLAALGVLALSVPMFFFAAINAAFA